MQSEIHLSHSENAFSKIHVHLLLNAYLKSQEQAWAWTSYTTKVSVSCMRMSGLTCRPLCNDEKCGKDEDRDLAAWYASASIARSRWVVSHGGLKS